MTAEGGIDIRIVDGTAELRLVNPARRNAISAAMWHAIRDFAMSTANEAGLRVVTIPGDGEATVSAGADVSAFDEARSGLDDTRSYDDLVEEACGAVERIDVPTVALIRGPCMGAGASLAASCDLRVARDDAFFAVPAARLGLGYDPQGIARLLRVFGPAATRELLFTADRLPAGRAYALGAVNAVAVTADFDAIGRQFVARIAENAPLTLAAAKTAIRALTSVEAAGPLEAARRLVDRANASADYLEGRRAFAEKRLPRFTGR